MAEENENQAAAGAAPQPRISSKSQYVRDLSFENVAVQKAGGKLEQRPEIQVGVNLDAKKREDGDYEVILKINANAKQGENTIFIAEVEYGGVFEISGVPDTHIHPVLLIECPRILFPFARRIIADVTRDGGYPPLMLDLVDFAALYRQEAERRKAAQEAAPETVN